MRYVPSGNTTLRSPSAHALQHSRYFARKLCRRWIASMRFHLSAAPTRGFFAKSSSLGDFGASSWCCARIEDRLAFEHLDPFGTRHSGQPAIPRRDICVIRSSPKWLFQRLGPFLAAPSMWPPDQFCSLRSLVARCRAVARVSRSTRTASRGPVGPFRDSALRTRRRSVTIPARIRSPTPRPSSTSSATWVWSWPCGSIATSSVRTSAESTRPSKVKSKRLTPGPNSKQMTSSRPSYAAMGFYNPTTAAA